MKITLDGADLSVYTNAYLIASKETGEAMQALDPGFLIFSNEVEAKEAAEEHSERYGIECVVAPIIIKSRKV